MHTIYKIILLFLFLPSGIFAQSFLSELGKVAVERENGVVYGDELYQIGRSNLSEIVTDSVFHKLNFHSSRRRFGYIGNNHKRLWIHFTAITVSENDPLLFNVIGKSKTGNNICSFEGRISIIDSRILYEAKDGSYKFGLLLSKYKLCEDSTDSFSGVFDGYSASFWEMTDSQETIELVESPSAFDYNNWFVGTWKSYSSGKVQVANWGNNRIPNSKELDRGTSEFGPYPKFAEFGWKSFLIINGGWEAEDDQEYKWAKRVENVKWWQEN